MEKVVSGQRNESVFEGGHQTQQRSYVAVTDRSDDDNMMSWRGNVKDKDCDASKKMRARCEGCGCMVLLYI